ncbi:DegT/DnrJ/EryC1/StrS family aminotransferase [Mycobacterium branderi]|uniref:UDP-4-amino-4,6-dideoxy-N-acetyl-beta-L-altrosami ne transaminase n=1 Tax=Mycobacterium branderi TaxID=43348 RepID=A0A7I7WCU9_9MYCO|nr:DegT/DnrJ/EryC1/StrS family aminotransferase [Mycobacterium branderi]MCV7236397.1 DegT/DnrJ/EryC1/StrS family aminotransferase [Mycobacterium branderi]ORA32573.1 hypothetical protein BST20_24525 [Mycobacterium branderi]BBZ15284.1 UDP-4-amino-4,6-dideoxy-N-acetyl-beta-L-altrosami ne transaminase [Mycobacterium branderi]
MSELPYAKPYWDGEEAQALRSVLDSGMWTNGSQVAEFERLLSEITAAPVISLSSGTTAIFALLHALGVNSAGPRLLVTPTLNFAAAAAAARLLGWDVGLCDVRREDLNICPESLATLLESVDGRYAHIVVVPVHYAGNPVDVESLAEVCARHGADLVEDACHAIGAGYGDGTPVGSSRASRAAYFSFHPVKPIGAGEGGAVATHDEALRDRLRAFRNHAMTPVAPSDDDLAPWPYDIDTPGANFRLSEFHAALGVVQARRLETARQARAVQAQRYRAAFEGLPALRTLATIGRARSAHHLFPVVFDLDELGMAKRDVIAFLRAAGIGCQVHYTPLHRLGAFRRSLAPPTGFAVMDAMYPGLLSLPLWYGMSELDQDRVIAAVKELVSRPGASHRQEEKR